jgi:hypothetical protein
VRQSEWFWQCQPYQDPVVYYKACNGKAEVGAPTYSHLGFVGVHRVWGGLACRKRREPTQPPHWLWPAQPSPTQAIELVSNPDL